MENIIIKNFDINEDIMCAKKIITGELINKPFVFNKDSSVYIPTNENISDENYVNNLKNKNKVLSIIGSGDQIINSILLDSKEIVGVDISSFPKYFLPLKLAAIKTLCKIEYFEYFYDYFDCPFSKKYYEVIRNELEDNSRIFWDSLYNDFDGNTIYDSSLFSRFKVNRKTAIKFNPYLQEDNYKLVKDKLNNVNIELYRYNMFEINDLIKDKFDLVILSNIINYINQFCGKDINEINAYKKFLKSLPLNIDGIAITYNIVFNGEIESKFKEKEYSVYKVDSSFNLENELLIYKKKKY